MNAQILTLLRDFDRELVVVVPYLIYQGVIQSIIFSIINPGKSSRSLVESLSVEWT